MGRGAIGRSDEGFSPRRGRVEIDRGRRRRDVRRAETREGMPSADAHLLVAAAGLGDVALRAFRLEYLRACAWERKRDGSVSAGLSARGGARRRRRADRAIARGKRSGERTLGDVTGGSLRERSHRARRSCVDGSGGFSARARPSTSKRCHRGKICARGGTTISRSWRPARRPGASVRPRARTRARGRRARTPALARTPARRQETSPPLPRATDPARGAPRRRTLRALALYGTSGRFTDLVARDGAATSDRQHAA